jgi:hypothetical protein
MVRAGSTASRHRWAKPVRYVRVRFSHRVALGVGRALGGQKRNPHPSLLRSRSLCTRRGGRRSDSGATRQRGALLALRLVRLWWYGTVCGIAIGPVSVGVPGTGRYGSLLQCLGSGTRVALAYFLIIWLISNLHSFIHGGLKPYYNRTSPLRTGCSAIAAAGDTLSPAARGPCAPGRGSK